MSLSNGAGQQDFQQYLSLQTSAADQARRHLRQAAEAGHADARYILGTELLVAEQDDQRREGLAMIQAVAAEGHGGANYHLAGLYANGTGVAVDLPRALDCWQQAVTAENPWALYALGLALAQTGDEPLAVLSRAARAGLPLAFAAVALLLPEPQARPWRQRAAQMGLQPPWPRVSSYWPADDRSTDGASLSDPGNDPVFWPVYGTPAWQQQADSPRIRTAALFSALECLHLMMVATPHLQPSVHVDPVSGELVRDEIRTSAEWRPPLPARDLCYYLIDRRLAAAADMPVAHGEPLTLLHYRPGQQYHPHHDAFEPGREDRWMGPERGGQRHLTLLVYLNQVAAGGGTAFPELGLVIEPRPGGALLFDTCDAADRRHPDALHAGLPVQQGEKWLVSKWFRRLPIAR